MDYAGKYLFVSRYVYNFDYLKIYNYIDFLKHANSEVQKPTDDCVFRCRQSS